jgi:hypothetical protein
MMHYEQYVVAITNPNGKAYREFDPERLSNGRKSKIYLPFDSEYKILIKNNSDRRAKLTIDLDGTSISGIGGLVLDAYKTESIERFVDVAKKFLFVRKNDERVSDPSNSENGILRVKIEKEIAFQINPIWVTTSVWTTEINPYQNYPSTVEPYTTQNISCTQASQNASFNASCSYPRNNTPRGAMGTLRSAKPLKKTLLNEESGATIEGGNSSQIFGNTVWNGTDGVAYEFIFKLLGQQGVSDETRVEYQKYLELKKKFEG